MKILFIARHGSGDNDPEGAVAHALTELGHDVTCVHEGRVPYAAGGGCDFALFFKWADLTTMRSLNCPRVFWYFDLVEGDDPALRVRYDRRRTWMEQVTPLCLVGFCTDGDWVAKNPEKLVHLPQGADGRVAGPGNRTLNKHGPADVLFFGGALWGNGSYCGPKRAEWGRWAFNTFRERLRIVGDCDPSQRVVRRDLANLIADSKIVLCPDTPASDRYWSNRVFLSCGFQGFVVHPECALLRQYYDFGEELVTYRSRDELKDVVEHYLDPARDGERLRIARAGYERTAEEHLYKHRCAELVAEVKRRLG